MSIDQRQKQNATRIETEISSPSHDSYLRENDEKVRSHTPQIHAASNPYDHTPQYGNPRPALFKVMDPTKIQTEQYAADRNQVHAAHDPYNPVLPRYVDPRFGRPTAVDLNNVIFDQDKAQHMAIEDEAQRAAMQENIEMSLDAGDAETVDGDGDGDDGDDEESDFNDDDGEVLHEQSAMTESSSESPPKP